MSYPKTYMVIQTSRLTGELKEFTKLTPNRLQTMLSLSDQRIIDEIIKIGGKWTDLLFTYQITEEE